MTKPFALGETFSYDFEALVEKVPALKSKLIKNQSGNPTIDFADNPSVILLNQAILFHYFNIKNWSVSQENLCPPIPGRVHYIYNLADLIDNDSASILDIGCGANVIYPLLGTALYNWKFCGSDIDESSLKAAQTIINSNKLEKRIELRKQENPTTILEGIIREGEFYDAIICNPPFYSTNEIAEESNKQKNKNLHGHNRGRNFGGKTHEITFPGGEFQFINNMIYESRNYTSQVKWFTCLVNKSSSLKNLEKILAKSTAKEYKVLDMAQGQKKSRILAWRY